MLVERKFLASGPTGRSSALVRRFYAMDFLTRTANLSATVFQQWAEKIGGGDPGFRQVGILWLAGPDRAEHLRANVRRARELGVNVVALAPSEVQRARPRHGGRRRGARRLRAGVRVRGRRDDHERARHACPRAGGDDRPVRPGGGDPHGWRQGDRRPDGGRGDQRARGGHLRRAVGRASPHGRSGSRCRSPRPATRCASSGGRRTSALIRASSIGPRPRTCAPRLATSPSTAWWPTTRSSTPITTTRAPIRARSCGTRSSSRNASRRWSTACQWAATPACTTTRPITSRCWAPCPSTRDSTSTSAGAVTASSTHRPWVTSWLRSCWTGMRRDGT